MKLLLLLLLLAWMFGCATGPGAHLRAVGEVRSAGPAPTNDQHQHDHTHDHVRRPPVP